MSELFLHTHENYLTIPGWEDLQTGFTTRNGGVGTGDFSTQNVGLHVHDPDAGENRSRLAEILSVPIERFVGADQTHQDQIVKVSQALAGKGSLQYDTSIKRTDGLYTKEKNVLLTLCFADCIPLYFRGPDNLLGVAHAGWRSTALHIGGKMVRLWQDVEGADLHEVHAVIGPGIGPCCYTVDDHVMTQLGEVLQASSDTYSTETSKGQYALDLQEANRLLLIQEGIPEENIRVSSYCTSCESDLFFSHRRDNGKTGRMMSFIGRFE
ncbi:peptidoglycan editing factor PgeF [Paenalkalicoccus suaedae]|uniref:Purine nucleoside phosphorylase n=1 Tax=Paenalkalicoccus suaedae TaxID=2592382 RepID=A0A859FCW9_9BACI|nr:peptidoglycan editing factor PgeF [Paenalkalicoccus suaedae]QKS70688.1 peptidoglycan editing factor PgeF [Paenalkalicoccus suaedae]